MDKNEFNLTWKDVFNSQNVFPMDYFQCIKVAKKVGYNYIVFNERVYCVNDINMSNIICTDDIL